MKTEALLSPHMIASLKPKVKEYAVYDAGCPGLALRIQPRGARSWVIWERQNGKTRRVTLGKLDALDLDAARKAYRLRQAGVAAAVKPATRLTFGQLAKLFLTAKADVYRPRTLSCLGSYLDTQLLPAFGKTSLNQITTPDVADWFYRYSQTRSGGANAALIHFTTIWLWGHKQGHVPQTLPNPAAPLRKNKRAPRGRMLNTEDLKRLGAVLSNPPTRTQDAAEAVWLILLTGCRSGEILRLRWDEVQPDQLDLTQTKTGPRKVMLNDEAVKVLTLRRQQRKSGFVFPSPLDCQRSLGSINGAWTTIKRVAQLPDTLRLHDLRHTYASHSVLTGESLYLTGKLLGHSDPQSTERYAHLDGRALAKAADKVSARIARLMGG